MQKSDEKRLSASGESEFSRGWLVLAGCWLGVVISAPSIGAYLSGVFLQPLENEFGWSRSAISLHSLLSIGAFAFMAPFAGRLVDRYGVRRIALTSFLLYAGAQYSMSFLSDSLLHYYVLSVLIAIVAAGTTPVVFTKVVNAWFDKSRGLALGIALLGAGVTAAVGPVLLTHYVDTNGWRAGYQVLGVIVFIGSFLVVLMIKDSPKASADYSAIAGSASDQLTGLEVKHATRSATFRLIGVAFLMVSLAVGGLLLHFIPMMTDYGMSRAEAAQTASLVGLSVLIGRIGTGILVDRFFAPRVALVMVLCAALGYLALVLGGGALAFITAIAVGFMVGAEIDFIGYLAARYFGMKNYGVIYGALYGITILGVGLAPLLTGLLYDYFGNYQPAILFSVLSLVVSAYLFSRMPAFPQQFDDSSEVAGKA